MADTITLYHGTSERHLNSILMNGIVPRGYRGAESNWEDYPSADDRIYLTQAYGIYFAYSAAKDDERGVIIEVEVELDDLVGDEDAFAQGKFEAGHELEFLNDWDMPKRTSFWRHQLGDMFGTGEASLKMLGNCAHPGVVSKNKITRYRAFDVTLEIILNHDPVISLMNFHFCGEQYVSQMRDFMAHPDTAIFKGV